MTSSPDARASRAEALAWLASRTDWERLLADLRATTAAHAGAGAGNAPSHDAPGDGHDTSENSRNAA